MESSLKRLRWSAVGIATLASAAFIPIGSHAEPGQPDAVPISTINGERCIVDAHGPSTIFASVPGQKTAALATIEAFRGLLSIAGLKIGDSMLQNRFDEELDTLASDVWNKIRRGSQVYVLRVSLYQSESGILIIPGGGRLIEPVGRGATPIDALARDVYRPRIRGYQDSELYSYRNVTQYAILRERDGRLTCNVIPSAGREQLEADANRERRRLDSVEAWDVSAAGLGGAVNRSKAYDDLLTTYSQTLHRERAYESVRSAISDLKKDEAAFNSVYLDYLAAIRHANRLQDIAVGLQRVATFASIINNAASINQLVTSSGESVKIVGNVPDMSQVYRESQAAAKEGESGIIKLQAGWDHFKRSDDAVGKELDRAGVSVHVPLPKDLPIPLGLPP